MEPSLPQDTRLSSAGALLNLAVDDGCKEEVCASEAIHKLVAMLSPSQPLTLRSVASMTFTNLAACAKCAKAVTEAGALCALTQCLGKPTDDVLQEKASS